MYPIPVTTALCQGLAAALSGLRATVANHIAKAWHLEPLLALIYNRLTRMALRLDRLTQRWQAGTLPKPRAPQTRSAPTRPDSPKPKPIAVPKSHFWLVRLVQPTAHYIVPVENFLANPETRALVEAAPQAGRILRPLCRALGITPPEWLRLPARPVTPRKSRAKPPRPEPATPYRPLPAYIRAAVRAWKPKYG